MKTNSPSPSRPRLRVRACLTALIALLATAPLPASAAEVALEAWVQRYGSNNAQAVAVAVAVDASGNVVVTGTFSGDYYTAKYAEADGALLWEQRYNGVADGDDTAKAVAVDGSSNVVVTGYSYNATNYDYYTAKYAAADGTLLWEKGYNGSANSDDFARAVALDASGNVVVTGASNGSSGYADYYTAKYAAADGALLWERSYNGPANRDDFVAAVAVDTSGNVVVTGASFGAESDWDYYTAKYAAQDGALLWEQRYNGASNREDKAAAVAVDASGNAVVTGYSFNSQPFWSSDFYTAKYAARDGALLWERRYNGPGSVRDRGHSIAVDASGNVVVVGQSDYVRGCVGQDICGGSGDWYTAKYAAEDGTLLWEQRYRDWASAYDPRAVVAVDASGNAIILGQPLRYVECLSALVGACTNTPSDYFAVKYASADGALLWEKRYNGPDNGDDCARALALGPDGSVVITGSSDGDIGPGTTADYATVKYVTISYPTPVSLSLTVTAQGAHVRFKGDEGRTYRLQRASNPAGPWSTLATLTAPPDGAVEHLDPAPLSSPIFYRVIAP